MLSNTNEPSIEGIELFFSQADLQTLPSEEIELSARNSVLRVRKDSVPARVGMQVGDVVVGGLAAVHALQGGVGPRRLRVLRLSRGDPAIRLRVTVPEGAVGGQKVRVQTPSGPVLARVPPSLRAGDLFDVLVPHQPTPHNLIYAASAPHGDGRGGGGEGGERGGGGEGGAHALAGDLAEEASVRLALSRLCDVLKVRRPSSSSPSGAAAVLSEPIGSDEVAVLLRGQAVVCSYGLVMLLATAVELRSMWAA